MTTKSKLQKDAAPALPVEGPEDDRSELDQASGDPATAESPEEETAARQADSLSVAASTFTKSYLIPASADGVFDEDAYDHGPNKQNLIQEAINNGLRIIGLPKSDAKGDSPRIRNLSEDDGDMSPEEYHSIDLVDVDDIVQFVGCDLYDFGIPGRPKLNWQLTYAADAIPAHMVGAGPTDELTDQHATMAEVVSPRHVGSTGMQHLPGLGDNELHVDGESGPGTNALDL